MAKGLYYKNFAPAVPAGQELPWNTDLQAAIAESQKTGKPLLVDFSASWCPPCQVMKHEVWTDAAVKRTVEEKFVPVYLDVDQPETRESAQRYSISSIPAVLVLDANGQVLRQASFMNASQTLEFLQSAP